MNNNDSINRRHFLKHAGTAGVGLGMVGYFGSLSKAESQTARASARKIGANDKIIAAVVGTNSRGLAHIDCLGNIQGTEILYICDVDDRAIAKGIKEVAKKQKSEPKGLRDFRKMLEDKSVDVVTIATPDHWHAPMAIMAMAAGKHVYVEKPCSQNPYEGELLLQAVNKYQRVVQIVRNLRTHERGDANVTG